MVGSILAYILLKVEQSQSKCTVFWTVMDDNESLLKEQWGDFWPLLFFRMTEQPGGNPQSSAQVGISLQPPIEYPLQHVNNVGEQPPEGMPQTLQGISQRRAGKRPMNDDTASTLGHLDGRRKWPLGFPPVNLLPTESIPGNSSYLQMPSAIQPPPQVAGAYRSVQLEPTYPAGQDSAYPPAAPIPGLSGENYWKNQRSVTGVSINASDRRAGKRPMNDDTASILGHLAGREKGKGPLWFPPINVLPTESILVPHSGNYSYLQMPSTIQPPPQLVGAYQSVQLEPTYPAGQDSAYPPAAPIPGENYWKNQRSST